MRERPDIVFFGSSLVSAFWNGAATYYRGIIRELAHRGHRVTFYEPDAWDRQKHRDMPDPSWAKVIVYPVDNTDGLYRALEQARSADLLVKTSGVGVFDELLEKVVLEYKRGNAAAIFWDVDAPATLDRLKSNPHDYFHKLVPKYDIILTYGGGPPVVKQYAAFGARQCVPIYNALDPSTHYPVAPEPEYTGTLGFLGNRLPDREARVEEFFLKPAHNLSAAQFILGGNGWRDKAMPGNVNYLGHVYTTQHNAFNSTPLAVLNINRQSMASYGYSPATRVFEAAGAAACIITDDFTGIDEFLEPGREILTARDGDEVTTHIRQLTPERASRIGAAALNRVLAKHTYSHRVDELEAVLNTKC
jgi:spore maturation protein CgeB